MGFNTLNQYSATHKVYDKVGNIIPDICHSEGVSPAGEFKPAAWLPVQFKDKHFENWMVILPGKLIALDPDGCVMPAYYGASTTPDVTYTQNDIDAGTIDISTGLPVASTKVVNLEYLSGVKESGWTAALAGVSKTSGFMGRFGVAWPGCVSKSTVGLIYPIGVAPYAYLQWCGGDGFNPAEYYQYNYNMQHQVAPLCDYVIKLPLIPAPSGSETVDGTKTASALVIGTANVHSRAYAQANATGRYDATTGTVPVLSTYPVIAVALDNFPVAQNTARTTITLSCTAGDVSSILVNEKTALVAVTQAGDYFVDYPMGVIFIYSSDGTTVPVALSGATAATIVYYHYDGSATILSKFACVIASSSDLKAGDFLKCNTAVGSDWILADPTTDNFATIMGQVVGFEVHPKDYLQHVHTAFMPALATDATGSMANGAIATSSVNLGQMDQMPGSATGGVPDLIHYAGAADTLVLINLVSR
jgi:hypothetical protein